MQNKAQLDNPFVCAGNMVLFHIEKIPLTIINTDKSHVRAVMCAMLVNLTDIWSHASKSIGQLSPWLYTLLDVTWLWKKRILWFWPQQRNVCHTYIHWRYYLFGNLNTSLSWRMIFSKENWGYWFCSVWLLFIILNVLLLFSFQSTYICVYFICFRCS